MSCGRTVGHGETCVEGYLCETCAEKEKIQLENARLAIQVLKAQELMQALVAALNLNDAIMSELVKLGMETSRAIPMPLMRAKHSFDERMKKLFGPPKQEIIK